MVVHTYSIEELRANFKSIMTEVLDERLKHFTPSSTAQSEYVSEFVARCILAGQDEITGKPLSRPVFYKLRRQGKFQVYRPSEGRNLYKRSELISYVATTVDQGDSFLPRGNKAKTVK